MPGVIRHQSGKKAEEGQDLVVGAETSSKWPDLAYNHGIFAVSAGGKGNMCLYFFFVRLSGGAEEPYSSSDGTFSRAFSRANQILHWASSTLFLPTYY